MHSEAVIKSPVAIILNIMSTMLFSRTIKNLALGAMTLSDGVEYVAQRGGGAKGGGGAGSAPVKSATVMR